VEGLAGSGSRYSPSQRQRLLSGGARDYFRLDRSESTRPLLTMGDCGAFSYRKAEVPPFTVEQVLRFYDECRVDYGVSVDHLIGAFDPEMEPYLPGLGDAPHEYHRRQQLTLTLAEDFLRLSRSQVVRLTPMGVAQGWSPGSYADAVGDLQKMGYKLIALGGMVPLRTPEILQALAAVGAVRKPDTGFHLLGISRPQHILTFQAYGVVSFDSTSPLRQAFMDEKDNYYAPDRTYTAIRVPQTHENGKLWKRIVAGEIDQNRAVRLEQACMAALAAFEREQATVDDVVGTLDAYEELYAGKALPKKRCRETLEARPWRDCGCEICRSIGIHVIIYRGQERNRRRGFHNLKVFRDRMRSELAATV
jgi:hypothetical protein